LCRKYCQESYRLGRTCLFHFLLRRFRRRFAPAAVVFTDQATRYHSPEDRNPNRHPSWTFQVLNPTFFFRLHTKFCKGISWIFRFTYKHRNRISKTSSREYLKVYARICWTLHLFWCHWKLLYLLDRNVQIPCCDILDTTSYHFMDTTGFLSNRNTIPGWRLSPVNLKSRLTSP
jgi:hypothetical protein